MQRFSIIIPVLNEAAHITDVLRALEPYASACEVIVEVIVVDGGSRDDTVALASRYTWARVIEFGQAQRAAQMNAGAAVAGGEVLLFLHADVRLPVDFPEAIQAALRDERCVGGCFAFGFSAEVSRAFRVYARGINWRTRWGWNATGDQTLWVRREVFEQLSGFRPLPIMEDLEFFAALKRCGRVALLAQRVTVSPRRWQKHGLLRTALLMYALRFGHWLGIAPAALKRFFLEVR